MLIFGFIKRNSNLNSASTTATYFQFICDSKLKKKKKFKTSLFFFLYELGLSVPSSPKE